ncbi:MAG: hypothetical protein EBU90_00150 [Proteobacteria bacterium]|nr:hypothetical protein [Pseudomonadota bacterium]NBP12843.1 hypothetical protein [bacterium]
MNEEQNLGETFLQAFYDHHCAGDAVHKFDLIRKYFFDNEEIMVTGNNDKENLAVLEYFVLDKFGFNLTIEQINIE